MSDVVLASLIGVGGAVLVSVVSVLAQVYTTKHVIASERDKILRQLQGEDQLRMRERWVDRFLDAMSELLKTSDPQSNSGVDYGKTVNLILRIQLLLDAKTPTHIKLCGALNALGIQLQQYAVVETRHIDDKISETSNLLKAQDLVLECAKTVLVDYRPPQNTEML